MIGITVGQWPNAIKPRGNDDQVGDVQFAPQRNAIAGGVQQEGRHPLRGEGSRHPGSGLGAESATNRDAEQFVIRAYHNRPRPHIYHCLHVLDGENI